MRNNPSKSGKQLLYYTRNTCRGCLSRDLSVVVPLAPLPVASPNVGDLSQSDAHVSAPTDMYQCKSCGLIQLATVIDPEFQYSNFLYKTNISVGLSDHFKAFLDVLASQDLLGSGKFLFEIGSNDGSLLAHGKQYGARVLGIDPAVDIARQATKNGYPTIGDFFTRETARKILGENGKADVIISNNTVANIDDLDDLFLAAKSMLTDDGVFVIETQYALDVFKKNLLDVIYHEHISYFSIAPMDVLLSRLGLELYDAEEIAPKGGSIRFYIQHESGPKESTKRLKNLRECETQVGLYNGTLIQAFTKEISSLSDKINNQVNMLKEQRKPVYAFGSSVGCAALVHYFKLEKKIEAIFDDTPLCHVMRTTSGEIPVLPGKDLSCKTASNVIILAWRYLDSIIDKQKQYCDKGGGFYCVLPDPEIMHPTAKDL